MDTADQAAVLFANEAFYVAFQTGDAETMETLWANDALISCIHPGWQHLMGRDVVIEAWHSILANPPESTLKMGAATANVYGDMAVVICYESLGDITLAATNIYVREDNLWKLIHHQAGQSPPPPADEDPEARETMQ